MKKTLDIDSRLLQSKLVDAGYAIDECGFEDQRLRPKPKQYIHLYTSNGIRSEITIGHFLFANYKSSENVRELVATTLEAKGHEVSIRKEGVRVFYSVNLTQEQIADIFISILTQIEEIDGLVRGNRNIPVFKIFDDLDDEINASVEMFLTAMRVGSQRKLNQYRTMLSADDMDSLITCGYSLKYSDFNKRREHVVPVIIIFNEMKRLYAAKASKEEIANLIKKNLRIVLISNEEQQRLDVELGMQTAMPEGWKWGDDIFARLHAAGIEFVQY